MPTTIPPTALTAFLFNMFSEPDRCVDMVSLDILLRSPFASEPPAPGSPSLACVVYAYVEPDGDESVYFRPSCNDGEEFLIALDQWARAAITGRNPLYE